MPPLLAALLLGIIEGVTELLPNSSTGHQLLAERWLGHRSDLFNIAIQAGAILAVVLVYRQRLLQLAWSFLGHSGRAGIAGDAIGAIGTTDAAVANGNAGLDQPPRDYALKLGAAFLVTAVLGLLVKKLGWQLDDAVAPIAWALILGGAWMLLAEHFAAKRAIALGERARITWTVAILVGIAQVVAGVFPGTSRSAATIFVALLFGVTSRAAATEFAFLVGIPTMFAATAYELLDLVRHEGIGGEDWTALGIAFAASAVTAFIAVKWLLRYIQSNRFTAFAIYRFALGVALLAFFA
jgi:undecaprenyl-diphosphatase